jgi:NAD(P)-dependent dehydrogenase (short-subunit alcohol dehydrogenase family)
VLFPRLDFGHTTANLKLQTQLTMEIVLVTGANRGIGLALTRVLLACGNVVIAGCRRPDESDELTQLTLLHPETIKKLGPELNGQFLDRNGRVGEYRW